MQTIWGIHAIEAMLNRSPENVLSVFVGSKMNHRVRELVAHARAQGISIQSVSKAALDHASQGANHQGIVAECRAAGIKKEFDTLLEEITPDTLLLICDGITDPHNLGAMLRTADAAGVQAVILPKDKSVQVNATVKKVASGAAETVPVISVTNLARSLDALKKAGVWCIGAAGEADATLYEQGFSGATAIIMGSEGSGLRRLTREACDVLVSIPMRGTVSSLNVSVATGVLLFEVQRSRSKR